MKRKKSLDDSNAENRAPRDFVQSHMPKHLIGVTTVRLDERGGRV